MSKESLRWRFM